MYTHVTAPAQPPRPRRRAWRATWKRWLGHPRAPLVVILLALLLLLPSLTSPFAADDHLQRIVLRDDPGLPGVQPTTLDLFSFASGDPAQMKVLMDQGVFPWTTAPDLRLAFMRPLSALTHLADHALWPGSAALAHLHSLLWFGLLLLALARLYREVFASAGALGAGAAGRWVAGLALLLYAVDDVHGPSVGWIANRQAVIATAFGLLAVLFHHRARAAPPGGRRSQALLAVVAFAAALLAGESGLGALAYLVAHALCLDPAPRRARAVALVPYALVAALWAALYVALGYGAHGSGVYIDPGGDPLVFAGAIAQRAPVLLSAQLAGVWSDVFPALPPDVLRLWVLGAYLYLLLALDAFKVVLAARPEARFWALGMVLAVLPIASTFPADRLLLFVGVGAMGLVACFLAAPEGAPGVRPHGRLRRFTVRSWTVGLVLAHLVIGPLTLPIRALTMTTVQESLDRADRTVPKDPGVRERTVVAVNPPSDPYLAFVPIERAARGEPIPGRQRWLAVGQTPVTVTRLDARTLSVSVAGGYLAMPSERLVRGPREPLRLGDVVELAGVRVTVAGIMPDGRPWTTWWRFDRPLDDPSFDWLRWSDDPLGFVPWTPPAVGDTVTLPAVDTLRAFLGP